ncbi:MAG: hypothetical protein AMS17_07280 [Spirochaetes bacterium DG_61]|jgi:hypothetical protein|nr:MAG: hypothetical protein AMS17_07280 [Spirochaetes bacterium DG_61]
MGKRIASSILYIFTLIAIVPYATSAGSENGIAEESFFPKDSIHNIFAAELVQKPIRFYGKY